MSSAVNHLQIPEEEHPRKGKPPSLPTANEVTHSPGKISLRESFREGNVAKFWEGVRKKSHSELCLVLRLMRGSGSTDDEKIPKERYSASTGNLRRRGRRQVIAWQNYTPHHLQKQFMLVQEEKAMQAVPSMPIDASKFVAYVTERRKKRILFKGEYLMILRSIDPVKCISTVGESLINRNTYPDTLPYDYNRVVLNALPGDENSHYINASYVNSWVREKAYVVTQAVKTKPANVEFWRMVWELESTCIVMLTKVFDFMRVMCMQYWPVTSFQYGTILVETLETKTYAHFVIRNLRLTRVENGEGMHSRELRHFHFTEWELDSFPYISAFIELRRRVRKFTDKCRSDAPIIVHCR
ncbi:hypothetical protein AB6A40_001514 [Gnathostoma spinigerum]|uniref:Tyrosine-protein phosphatase domain-containing protein n=1 Tax=Gnathostoma spinigerum TaxID=75299 RepID=A0ABD6EEP6_9BILA